MRTSRVAVGSLAACLTLGLSGLGAVPAAQAASNWRIPIACYQDGKANVQDCFEQREVAQAYVDGMNQFTAGYLEPDAKRIGRPDLTGTPFALDKPLTNLMKGYLSGVVFEPVTISGANVTSLGGYEIIDSPGKELYLKDTQISSLEPLANKSNGKNLVIHNNPNADGTLGGALTSLRGLRGNTTMRHLEVAGQPLEKIEGLDGIPLEELWLAANKIKEISGLDNLGTTATSMFRQDPTYNTEGDYWTEPTAQSLTWLDLRSNEISEFKGLDKLPETTRWIRLDGNELYAVDKTVQPSGARVSAADQRVVQEPITIKEGAAVEVPLPKVDGKELRDLEPVKTDELTDAQFKSAVDGAIKQVADGSYKYVFTPTQSGPYEFQWNADMAGEWRYIPNSGQFTDANNGKYYQFSGRTTQGVIITRDVHFDPGTQADAKMPQDKRVPIDYRDQTAPLTEPAAPSATGKDFVGWSTDAEGKNMVTFPYNVTTPDTTLYAQWEDTKDPAFREFPVTLDFNYANGPKVSINVRNQKNVPAQTDPVRDGYDFQGWFDAAEGGTKVAFDKTPITKAQTFYAQWKGVQRTVTITDQNGDKSEIPVVNGDKIGDNLPDNPEKDGKPGIWVDQNGKEVTKDTVITGDTQITPKFPKDEGPADTKDDGTVPPTTVIPSPDWDKDSKPEDWKDINGKDVIPGGSLVDDTGKVIAPEDLAPGSLETSVSETGSKEAKCEDPAPAVVRVVDFKWTMPSGNVKTWSREYTFPLTKLNVNPNNVYIEGALPPVVTLSFFKGCDLPIAKMPNTSTHEFINWTEGDKAGGPEITSTAGKTESFSIYGNWKQTAVAADQITVTFDYGRGAAPTVFKVNKGYPIVRPDAGTYEGHTFENWYVRGADSDTLADFSKPLTTDTTFVAKWKADVKPEAPGPDGTKPGGTDEQGNPKPGVAPDKPITDDNNVPGTGEPKGWNEGKDKDGNTVWQKDGDNPENWVDGGGNKLIPGKGVDIKDKDGNPVDYDAKDVRATVETTSAPNCADPATIEKTVLVTIDPKGDESKRIQYTQKFTFTFKQLTASFDNLRDKQMNDVPFYEVCPSAAFKTLTDSQQTWHFEGWVVNGKSVTDTKGFKTDTVVSATWSNTKTGGVDDGGKGGPVDEDGKSTVDPDTGKVDPGTSVDEDNNVAGNGDKGDGWKKDGDKYTKDDDKPENWKDKDGKPLVPGEGTTITDENGNPVENLDPKDLTHVVTATSDPNCAETPVTITKTVETTWTNPVTKAKVKWAKDYTFTFKEYKLSYRNDRGQGTPTTPRSYVSVCPAAITTKYQDDVVDGATWKHIGWSVDGAGNKLVTSTEGLSGDVVLVANWKDENGNVDPIENKENPGPEGTDKDGKTPAKPVDPEDNVPGKDSDQRDKDGNVVDQGDGWKEGKDRNGKDVWQKDGDQPGTWVDKDGKPLIPGGDIIDENGHRVPADNIKPEDLKSTVMDTVGPDCSAAGAPTVTKTVKTTWTNPNSRDVPKATVTWTRDYTFSFSPFQITYQNVKGGQKAGKDTYFSVCPTTFNTLGKSGDWKFLKWTVGEYDATSTVGFTGPITAVAHWQNIRTGAISPTPAGEVDGAKMFTRYQGVSRYTTADYGNKDNKVKGGVAFLVTGENYPDALSIAPAVIQQKGALYLVDPKAGISDDTLALIEGQRPKEIVVVGGRVALPDASFDKLTKDPDYKVTRVSGSSRSATSVEIAKKYFNGADKAFVSTGYNFADALGIGSYAGSINAPIILIDGKSTHGFESELDVLDPEAEITILGGNAAVNPAFDQSLAGTSYKLMDRIKGGVHGTENSRYGTSAEIARLYPQTTTGTWIVTGENFPDALVAATIAGRQAQPVLMSKADQMSESIQTAVKGFDIAHYRYTMGGPRVMQDATAKFNLTGDVVSKVFDKTSPEGRIVE